jgi:hypothetical protein
VRATGIVRAWRMLPPDRRLAAMASIGLFLTLFLPWYQVTVIAPGRSAAQVATAALTGWGSFSFVEAAVLVVAAGVLTLLYRRAQGRAFHLPGGDGGVITAAGAWTTLLIIWRIFDKQGTHVTGPGAETSGIEWGIFIALGVAALLAYAGSRIRAANQPEPPLPGEDESPVSDPPSRRGGRPDRSPSFAADGSPSLAADRSPRARSGRARSPRPVAAPRQPRPLPAEPRGSDAAGDDTPALRRDPASGRVARDPRFGPTIVPDDPPTLRIARADRRSNKSVPSTPPAGGPPNADDDDQLTIPLDGEGFEKL